MLCWRYEAPVLDRPVKSLDMSHVSFSGGRVNEKWCEGMGERLKGPGSSGKVARACTVCLLAEGRASGADSCGLSRFCTFRSSLWPVMPPSCTKPRWRAPVRALREMHPTLLAPTSQVMRSAFHSSAFMATRPRDSTGNHLRPLAASGRAS